MRFAEDKITRGKKFAPSNAKSIYDGESIAFARKERLRKLPSFQNDVPVALLVQSATLAQHPTDQSVFTVELRYHGRTMATSFSQGSAFLDPPEFWSVLHCLLLDISGIEDETFESWCGNYGYSADSRQAEKTFNACRDTLSLVKRLLGRDFDEIRALDEDGIRARFENVKTFKAL